MTPILKITVDDRGDSAALHLEGELDIASAEALSVDLERVEQGRPGTIVIDLSGLRFMDSSGLRVLVAANTRAADAGRRLAIVPGPEAVARVFTLTGLDEHFQFVADAELVLRGG